MIPYFIFTISCCIIIASSQQIGKNGVLRDDSIHFVENGQTQNNRNIPQTESYTLNQKSKDGKYGAIQDSYFSNTQGISSEGQSSNQVPYPGGEKVKLPSMELQPPGFGQNNGVDYYTSQNPRVAEGILNRNGEPDIPSEKPIQVTNSSRAMINFGLSLLKNIEGYGKNVVVSPYSVATVLALLQQGASGTTQQQISQALQMTPVMSQENFKKFSDEFQKRNSRNILRVANNIYIADSFSLNPIFKKVATSAFGSEVTPIRFAEPEQAVRKINSWVAAKTNNKIQELLSAYAVGENTEMVLLNAVYFKGLWQVRFKPESTLPRPFHLAGAATIAADARAGDVTKSVPFMRMRRMFRTGVDAATKAQVIILPFENEQYSLMLVLPSETSSLNAIVSTMTNSQLADYLKFSPKEVDFEVPKFTVRSDIKLNSVLREMGITNIFTDMSELLGLGSYRSFAPQVSSAFHSAMLSIDEDGGTAAAATAFAVVALSYTDPSVVFKANRPFLAVLWDNQEALPLFMARVEDPTVQVAGMS